MAKGKRLPLTIHVSLYIAFAFERQEAFFVADILLDYPQRIVLKEACIILGTPPDDFTRGLFPLYMLGRKGSISSEDLGLLATCMPGIIDRLKKATDARFLTELAMRISDRNIAFDRAVELACKHLATSDG